MAASASDPPDGLDALAAAYEASGDELAGHRKAAGVAYRAGEVTVLCAVSGERGREQTELIRLDDAGEVVWRRAYATSAGRAIAALPDGGFVIAGDVQRGPLEFSAHVLTVDGTGEVVRERALGSSATAGFRAVAVGGDGSTMAAGADDGQAWLVSGDWEHRDARAAAAVAVSGAAGGFTVAAVSDPSTTALGKTLLARFDDARTERWSCSLPQGEPAGLAALADGGVLLVGHRAPDGAGCAQIWVMQLDGDGKAVWERLLGAAGEERRGRAAVLLPGEIIAVAGDASHERGRGIRLARLGGDGAVQWQRSYADDSYASAGGLAATAEGHLLLVSTEAAGPKMGAMIRRLGGDGTPLWQRAL